MDTVTSTALHGANNRPQAQEDYRARVAHLRRERMRMRLIESALHVFASKGIDATEVKDVIEYAGVSRGSFYNYFQTTEDLMGAVLQVLSNELLHIVDAVVLNRTNPAERVACGTRLVLHTARQHPLLARFAARVGIQQLVNNSLALQYLPRDITAGIDAGLFKVASPMAALTLALGSTHAAICAMSLAPDLPADFPEEIAFQTLMGLGLHPNMARRLIKLPLDEVSFPPEALLARTLAPDVSL